MRTRRETSETLLEALLAALRAEWWQWEKGKDEELFDKYVIIPAILMIGDTLLNLQRSGEAKEYLKTFTKDTKKCSKDILFSKKYISDIIKPDNYKIIRNEILNNRADNDSNIYIESVRDKQWDKIKERK